MDKLVTIQRSDTGVTFCYAGGGYFQRKEPDSASEKPLSIGEIIMLATADELERLQSERIELIKKAYKQGYEDGKEGVMGDRIGILLEKLGE